MKHSGHKKYFNLKLETKKQNKMRKKEKVTFKNW